MCCVFSTIYTSSVDIGALASKCFYKNITLFNLSMRLIFAVVGIIINQVTQFITKTTYYFLDFKH